MAKKRRKAVICYNCQTTLTSTDNFCPNCGQENHDRQASTKDLVDDFMQDYVGFDNKVVRSLKPLLFQPGVMTKKFLDGQRKSFIAPIRLFLFMSFIYFGLQFIFGAPINASITLNGSEASGENAQKFYEAMRENINLLFFLFTPLQALIIMALFRTKERSYYVNFFVYTLHLFSFLFILGTVAYLIRLTLPDSDNGVYLLLTVYGVLFIYVVYYSIVSLKRVFEKKGTIFRFILVLLISVATFIMALIGFILLLGWMYHLFDAPM